MASIVFDSFLEYLGDGTIDMDTHSFKAMLIKDTYTPDKTDTVYGDLSSDELANGNGYVTGGVALQNTAWTKSGSTTKFDADDPAWANITFSGVRYVGIYDDSVADPVKPLVCLWDLLTSRAVTAGPFMIRFDAAGIFTLTAA